MFDDFYFADSSVHIFDKKIYIYPSHDIQTQITEAADGGHFKMKDYLILTLNSPTEKGKVVRIAIKQVEIMLAEKQFGPGDIAKKGRNYYFYFPAKGQNGIFTIGVAMTKNPADSFKAEKNPIGGKYSIDPKVLDDKRK